MPEVKSVRHHVVDLADVRVHLAEWGDGPPLFLLHGWPQHWYCWRRLVPLLDGFRLIMPDMRGFGWSSVPRDGYRTDVLVDDLLEVMDTLEVERAGIIGHDWGGWTAFSACMRAPERFSALLAVSVVHPWVPLDLRTIAQLWRFGYQPVLAGPFGPAMLRHSKVLDRLLGSEPAIDDPPVYSSIVAHPDRARASQQLYRALLVEALPRLHRLRRQQLRVPTILVVGDRDPVIRPAMLGGFEQNAEHMSIEVLPGAGHFLPEETPIQLARIARDNFRDWRIENAEVGAGASSSASTTTARR